MDHVPGESPPDPATPGSATPGPVASALVTSDWPSSSAALATSAAKSALTSEPTNEIGRAHV